MADFTMQI